MRQTITILAVVGIYAYALGAPVAALTPPTINSKPRTTTITAPVETRLDLSTNQPIIEAMINGRGPYRLAVDTGSRYTILDDDLLRPIHTRKWREVRFDEGEPVMVVGIESVSINGAVFSTFEALMIDYDAVYDGKRTVDGILGFPVFSDCLLTLDYPANRVALIKGSLPKPDGREVLTVVDRDGLPTLAFQFQNTSVRAILGSATVDAFALATDLQSAVLPRTRTAKHSSGTRIEDIHPVAVKDTVTFGRYALAQPTVHFYGTESVVGHRVLSNFKVTFDQQHDRVRFLRKQAGPVEFLNKARFGLSIHWQGSRLLVDEVLPNSPASRVGLKKGDRIVYINNHRARDIDDNLLRDMLQNEDSLVMKVNREGFALLLQLNAEHTD